MDNTFSSAGELGAAVCSSLHAMLDLVKCPLGAMPDIVNCPPHLCCRVLAC